METLQGTLTPIPKKNKRELKLPLHPKPGEGSKKNYLRDQKNLFPKHQKKLFTDQKKLFVSYGSDSAGF